MVGSLDLKLVDLGNRRLTLNLKDRDGNLEDGFGRSSYEGAVGVLDKMLEKYPRCYVDLRLNGKSSEEFSGVRGSVGAYLRVRNSNVEKSLRIS